MCPALIQLGITIRHKKPESVLITGNRGHFRAGPVALHTGLSGTAAGFLFALALLRRDKTAINGLPPLRLRPNQHLVEVLLGLGASVCSTEDGYLPILIRGPEVVKASISLKSDWSSQYLSTLLLVRALLPNCVEVFVKGELVSRRCVDVTLREMLRFGVSVEREDYRRFCVNRQVYNPAIIQIKGDP